MSERESSNAFDTLSSNSMELLREAATAMAIWFSRLSDIERVAGLCLFIVALFGLALLVPAGRKRRRSNAAQFVMAYILVIGFSVGLGWRFAGGSLDLPLEGPEIARFWQDSDK